MALTQNTLQHFFTWWGQGLVNPLPLPSRIPTTISVESGEVHHAFGAKLSAIEVEALKMSDEVYLLVPSSKLISKRIPESQKSLPLSRIADDALPFEISELLICFDQREENILAIVRAELALQYAAVESLGLTIAGVAFDDEGKLLYANEHFESAHGESAHGESAHGAGKPAGKLISGKALMLGFLMTLLLITVFIAGFAFLSHNESLRASELGEQAEKLKAQLGLAKVQPIESFATQIEIRDASVVASYLTALAASLTETVSVDQLILMDNELLIDASAISATQVQANLDAFAVFDSTEFITSISRSTSEGTERFRLKVRLQEAN